MKKVIWAATMFGLMCAWGLWAAESDVAASDILAASGVKGGSPKWNWLPRLSGTAWRRRMASS